MNPEEKILQLIKQSRKDQKISGYEMANELGYKSPSTYYKKENGELPINISELYGITKKLKYEIFFTNKVSQ